MSIDDPKFLELTTLNENLVALFVDPKHELFGRLGKQIFHDWKEYGEHYLLVLGKENVRVSEGMCGNPPSPIILYYRLDDWENNIWDEKKQGLNSFKERYLSLGVGDIEKLKRDYKELFREDLA